MNSIRVLSWAPVQSNSDSANVIATAGHGGLKFWDPRLLRPKQWRKMLYGTGRHIFCVLTNEEESVVTINTPVPNNPFPLRTSRKAELNKVKREHDKIATASEDQVLALCYVMIRVLN
ncbi:uncharacterized protein LOC126788377 isoform X1 [Argentina anserina]|uniref:uncharacterized protein LOC126788377 isoform X1 n=1 Tax=Argentina anserina TaxID=57926 RepID=UPI0021767448|nr:uncharacterized protein LOC126788377 isoform X1 [Potentilla anserina]